VTASLTAVILAAGGHCPGRVMPAACLPAAARAAGHGAHAGAAAVIGTWSALGSLAGFSLAFVLTAVTAPAARRCRPGRLRRGRQEPAGGLSGAGPAGLAPPRTGQPPPLILPPRPACGGQAGPVPRLPQDPPGTDGQL